MKKQRAVNRLLSVILAIIMVFELLPTGLAVQAEAGGSGTQEDPVVVRNFAELKEALEAKEDLYIRVDEFENSEGLDYYQLEEGKDYYQTSVAISTSNNFRKDLELNTFIDLRDKSNGLEYLISNYGELTIHGNGGIAFSIHRPNFKYCPGVINSYGKLTVWGNPVIMGHTDVPEALCGAVSIYAGEADIRGGRFGGGGSYGDGPAFYCHFADITISAGVFESGMAGGHALAISEKADLKLSGGKFQGIRLWAEEESYDLSRYIGDCLYLINDEDLEDGTGKTKLEGEVKILNNNIPAVDVSVAIPYAGNTPADPVIVTEDVTVSAGTTKWERYDGTNWLAMGGDEAFIAGGKYRVSFIAEPTEGSGRFFSKKYPPTVRVNGDSTGVMPDPTGENDHYFILYAFTASPKYISSTNVNVEVPQAGATPKDAVSATGHTSVTKTEWFTWDETAGDYVVLQPTDVFESGKSYVIKVTVAADEGYRISSKPAGSFNADTEGTIESVSEGEYTYSASFKVPGKMIDAINVDIAEPVAGALPAAAVSTTAHVTVTETLWGKCTNEDDWIGMTAGETYVEGQVYHLEVTVETESGYEIGANPVLSFNTLTEAHVKNRSNTVIEMNAKFTAGGLVTISEMNVNLALPVAGAGKEEAIAATEHVQVTDTAWYYIDDAGQDAEFSGAVYEAGKTYVAYISMKADGGYVFAETPVLLVNGGPGAEFVQKTAEDTALFRMELPPVAEKTLENIVITKAPDKTMYAPGESFDPSGMEVTAEYTDGSSSVVTGYTITPTTGLQPGDTEVTVSYTVGSVTKTAKVPIQVMMIADNLFVSFKYGSSFTYTGAKITPPVEVRYNGKVLTEGVDYTVKYKNNIKASEGAAKQPTVTVTGKTFAASGSSTFTITRKDIADADVIAEGLTVAAGKTVAPALYYGGKKLGKKDFSNPDAKVTFSADGNITVEGKGNFCGTRTIPVHVGEVKKISVTAFTPAERIYNGMSQPLTAAELTVVSGSTTLELDKDYTVSYPVDDADAGTLKLAVVGIGEYSGSVSKSMKIAPCTSGVSVDVPASVEFLPGGAMPEVDVYIGAYKLSCGRDYNLKFSNNKAVTGTKKAYVTVKFTGNFKGCAPVTKEFDITPYDLSTHSVSLYAEDMIYTKPGKYRKTPYVEVNGKLLSAKDMELSYSVDGKGMPDDMKIVDDMMQSGKITIGVSATGKGNYTGTINGYCTLSKAEKSQDLSRAKVSVEKKKYEFYGGPIAPSVTVKFGKDTLVKDQDYTVSFIANVNKGKGICIITGLGDSGTGTKKYYGSKAVKFNIVKGKLIWM